MTVHLASQVCDEQSIEMVKLWILQGLNLILRKTLLDCNSKMKEVT